jgi:phage terminase large subunit-like protein
LIAKEYQWQVDAVQQYIDAVLTGEERVGELERLAVERYVHEREHGTASGLFYFDEDLARRSVVFFPMILKLTDGEWHGERFALNCWQSFVVWNLFGWRTKSGGLRRFRKAYISVGRKNGKTTLIAGLACLCMYAEDPPEHGAELYCTATTLDQASILYDMCEKLIRMSPSLRKRSKFWSGSLQNTVFDSYLKPLSARKGKHGSNPHLMIIDEMHEWGETHRPLYDAITTGSAARRQPLQIIITTAGDPGGESPIWQEENDMAEKVLHSWGSPDPVGEHQFSLICRVDKEDDPFNPKNFRKANPNLGISVKEDYLKLQAAEAKVMPSARTKFLRFHANYPTGSAEKAFDMEAWDACRREHPDLKDRDCYAGMDLGSVYDFAGFSLLFQEGDQEYWLKSWIWAAEKNPHIHLDRDPYMTWIKDGQMMIHEGTALDFEKVREDILHLCEDYNVMSLAFDAQQARLMALQLEHDLGAELVEFIQAPSHYNEPLKVFIHRINEQRIWHDGSPALRWQADNLIIKRNVMDKWMPDKSSPMRKVDGIVASIMGFSEALFNEQEKLDYYDSHELEIG